MGRPKGVKSDPDPGCVVDRNYLTRVEMRILYIFAKYAQELGRQFLWTYEFADKLETTHKNHVRKKLGRFCDRTGLMTVQIAPNGITKGYAWNGKKSVIEYLYDVLKNYPEKILSERTPHPKQKNWTIEKVLEKVEELRKNELPKSKRKPKSASAE